MPTMTFTKKTPPDWLLALWKAIDDESPSKVRHWIDAVGPVSF